MKRIGSGRPLSLKLISVFVLMLFCAVAVHSAFAEEMRIRDVEAVLKTFVPNVVILSVEKSTVENVWEVVIDSGGQKGIVYIDSAKRNLIFGSIVDIITKENLTKRKFDELNRVDVSMIPLDDALVMGKKDARYRIVVFDDPD